MDTGTLTRLGTTGSPIGTPATVSVIRLPFPVKVAVPLATQFELFPRNDVNAPARTWPSRATCGSSIPTLNCVTVLLLPGAENFW